MTVSISITSEKFDSILFNSLTYHLQRRSMDSDLDHLLDEFDFQTNVIKENSKEWLAANFTTLLTLDDRLFNRINIGDIIGSNCFKAINDNLLPVAMELFAQDLDISGILFKVKQKIYLESDYCALELEYLR